MPSEIFINHLDKIFWLGVGGAGFSFWVIRMNYSHWDFKRVQRTAGIHGLKPVGPSETVLVLEPGQVQRTIWN